MTKFLKNVLNFCVISSIIFFSYANFSFADMYAPGETLDPACAPTDLNCGVQPVTLDNISGSLSFDRTQIGGILSTNNGGTGTNNFNTDSIPQGATNFFVSQTDLSNIQNLNTLATNPSLSSCNPSQIPQFDGSTWICADMSGFSSDLGSMSGAISLESQTSGVLSVNNGGTGVSNFNTDNIPQGFSNLFINQTDLTTIQSLNPLATSTYLTSSYCSYGQVPQFDGLNWSCTSLSADSVVQGSSNLFISPTDLSTIQNLNNLATNPSLSSCTSGQVPQFDGLNWSCTNIASASSQWKNSSSDIYFNTGKVGIGTTTPGHSLHVKNSSDSAVMSETSSAAAVGEYFAKADGGGVLQTLMFGTSAAGTLFNNAVAGAAYVLTNSVGGANPTLLGIGTLSATPLVLGTNNTERMRITSAGTIGIGTTTPNSSYKLDVNGNINASGEIYRQGVALVPGSVNGNYWNTATGGIQYSGGNVAVGTTINTLSTLAATLNVAAVGTDFNPSTNTGTAIRMGVGVPTGNNSAYIQVYNSGYTGTNNLVINAGGGNVGIGILNPQSTLTVGNTDSTAKISSGGLNTNLTISAVGRDGNIIFGAGSALNDGTPGIERMRITNDGRLYGTSLHNNPNSVSGTTNQYIASGTYTPTITNGANVESSIAYVCQWMRVGNVVTVGGRFLINTATALAPTVISLSLPIASDFTIQEQLGGNGVAEPGDSMTSSANATTNLAQFESSRIASTVNSNVMFTFTYVIQ